MWKMKNVIHKFCEFCQTPFVPGRCNPYQRFCSERCRRFRPERIAAHNRQAKAYALRNHDSLRAKRLAYYWTNREKINAKKKQLHPKKPLLPRLCEYCGTPFRPTCHRHMQRFCSERCNYRNYLPILRLQGRLKRGSQKDKIANCLRCNSLFRINKTGQRYCCEKCARNSWNAAHPGYARDRQKIGRNELRSYYVRQVLASGTSLAPLDFPPEIVEIQRNKLRLLRAKRKLQL